MTVDDKTISAKEVTPKASHAVVVSNDRNLPLNGVSSSRRLIGRARRAKADARQS